MANALFGHMQDGRPVQEYTLRCGRMTAGILTLGGIIHTLTFDGVDMNNPAKPVLAVYVDIYYIGDVDYDKDAYGTLCIYDYKAQREPYELSKKEIVSLIQ